MDLRVKRTRLHIRQAFLGIASKKKINRITIKELAEAAMINKATFYLHYHDLEDLVSEIEDHTVTDIVESFGQVGSFFHNVDFFIKKFVDAMERNREILLIFYYNDRTAVIQNKLVASLRMKIIKENPHITFTREMYIILTFFLRAALDLGLYEEIGDYNSVFKAISKTITVVTSHYQEQLRLEEPVR